MKWQPCQLADGTLPETNIAAENRVSQKETSIPTIHFRGYVSFREGGSLTWKVLFFFFFCITFGRQTDQRVQVNLVLRF